MAKDVPYGGRMHSEKFNHLKIHVKIPILAVKGPVCLLKNPDT
jgi:hypothetical protein